MAKKEPSNRDILEGMNGRFNLVFAEFNKNSEKFVLMSKQMGTFLQGQGALEEHLQKHSSALEEIQMTLKAFGKAIDADAVRVLRHGKRITRLEKALR